MYVDVGDRENIGDLYIWETMWDGYWDLLFAN